LSTAWRWLLLLGAHSFIANVSPASSVARRPFMKHGDLTVKHSVLVDQLPNGGIFDPEAVPRFCNAAGLDSC
jgi:hypothetical protein